MAATSRNSLLDRHRLIGVVILVRFMELPLSDYETLVEKVIESLGFTQPGSGDISPRTFPRARVLKAGETLTSHAIGQLRIDEEGVSICYRHPALAQEYAFAEKTTRYRGQTTYPGQFPDQATAGTKVQVLRRQLRLINTRNRLTYMTLLGIARHQAAYLTSGEAVLLKPLSQVLLAEWIRKELREGSSFLPPKSGLEYVDHSMISRLTRHMSVLTPQGQEIPLRDLFPTHREVYRQMITLILDEEREQIRRGEFKKGYTDAEIRQWLKRRFGVSISRRTVSAIRQSMHIPSSRTRNSNHAYPPQGVHFSFTFPLNMAAVRANAPQASGVYEISLSGTEIDYPLASSQVIYIGSTKNLQKRLRDHLIPSAKNGDLRRYLANHPTVFRYILEPGDVRAVEKRLCRCFVLAHGALPRCNCRLTDSFLLDKISANMNTTAHLSTFKSKKAKKNRSPQAGLRSFAVGQCRR
jgi:RNA polymerase sigma-54 factor